MEVCGDCEDRFRTGGDTCHSWVTLRKECIPMVDMPESVCSCTVLRVFLVGITNCQRSMRWGRIGYTITCILSCKESKVQAK